MKRIVITILALESRLILRTYKPFIIAVTGSVGKTSTKDAIYEALVGRPDAGFVRKSEKSMNSEIGLPLTVIGASNAWHDAALWLRNIWIGARLILWRREYPTTLILEIGADHPGDIKRVTRWLKPDIAVITRVSRTPVHVEFFKSPEEVFEEKAALASAVKPGGALVIFGDDERTLSMGDRVKDRNVSVVSYGMNERCAIRATEARIEYEQGSEAGGAASGSDGGGATGAPVGTSFNVEHRSPSGTVASQPVFLKGVLGAGAVYSALAAAAVLVSKSAIRADSGSHSDMPYGIMPDTSMLGITEPPHGRMNIIPGLNGSIVIDDSYNSSPDAVSAALAVMKDLRCSGRKIAALADMMELGKFSAQEHRRLGGEAAAALGPTGMMVTVGQRSRATAEEAAKSGMPVESVRPFDSSKEAASFLAGTVARGDIILVKGSQSMRMERVSAALLREPEKAATLLVRQEKEWLAKP